MMKKVCSMFMVCLIILAMSVTAFAGEISITQDAQDPTLITVTGSGFTQGEQIGILALKPGVDLDGINENDPIQSIDYIDQVEAVGQDGTFEFTFKSNGVSGTYSVYYTGNTTEALTYTIGVDSEKGSISGKVTSKGDNTKISVTAKKDGVDVKSVNPDEDGNFTIDGLEAGTYSVVITKIGYITLTVNGIEVTTAEETLAAKELLAGDVTGDTLINSSDLGPLLDAFNAVLGNDAYDENMDFDDNTRINSSDLAYLLDNFNKTAQSYQQ